MALGDSSPEVTEAAAEVLIRIGAPAASPLGDQLGSTHVNTRKPRGPPIKLGPLAKPWAVSALPNAGRMRIRKCGNWQRRCCGGWGRSDRGPSRAVRRYEVTNGMLRRIGAGVGGGCAEDFGEGIGRFGGVGVPPRMQGNVNFWRGQL